MAKYTPRLTAPSTTNKNYLHYSSGGYNYCIKIKGNSCLPNCTGFAWGRWRELLGKKHNLSLANAENWYVNTKDGYERGKTPKLGAIICWRKGKVGVASDGAGHVAVVEQIKNDGTIVVSESAYGGVRWRKREYKAPNYVLSSKYTFQGFIYPPVDFKLEEKKENTSNNKVIKKKKATGYATSKSSSLSGTYVTTAALNIRNGAGIKHSIMTTVPKGTKVKCYGYYTSVSDVKWLYVQFVYKNIEYTGFASSEYLKKQ